MSEEIQEVSSFLSDMGAVQRWAYRIAKMKGFHNKSRSKGEAIALIHSEVSELLEAERKNPEIASEHIPEFTAVEEEIADVIIRLMDYAEEFYSDNPGHRTKESMDIGSAIVAKIMYNSTRDKMHGGKRF